MSTEPDNLVLELLRDMRAEMATKADIADLRSELHSLRADVASDFIEVRREIAASLQCIAQGSGGARRQDRNAPD